ncbi:chalcone isomerase family protein [Thiolinea disciformis]|uniref:chalcone isomerase family protein n=1 Tax=Thiolinea disciformis TaxID=125614 RepID=UPI00037E3494|nr:chalcone isomerase family protein [Thiolinea disciformis]
MYKVIKRWSAGLVLACLFMPLGSYAADAFPAQQAFAGQNLSLNGKGVRTKLLFNLYTAGLYLTAPSTDANAILKSNDPMAIRLHITSGMITSEKMEEAVREGFKLSAGNQASALQPRIEQLIAVFKTPIKQGDIYDLVYKPTNVIVVKNGKPAATIAGADFKSSLYSIWLGARPVQGNLKQALLGAGQ